MTLTPHLDDIKSNDRWGNAEIEALNPADNSSTDLWYGLGY